MFSKIFPPIHTEGYKFLVIAGFITLVLLFISGFLGTIGMLLTVWVCYFFRDPERVIIEDDNYLVSPADGEVISGESTVSQANITGESLPVDKHPGDEVFSGTINLSGSMDIKVTRVGSETTLGQVQKLILQAEATKIPIFVIFFMLKSILVALISFYD